MSPRQDYSSKLVWCFASCSTAGVWGSHLIFPATWKAEWHVRKQFTGCESSWRDLSLSWVPGTPPCTPHHPAPRTGLSPTLHTEICKKQQPVLLHGCQTVNSSTNTSQKTQIISNKLTCILLLWAVLLEVFHRATKFAAPTCSHRQLLLTWGEWKHQKTPKKHLPES